MLNQRIKQPNLQTYKPDDPTEEYIRTKYMLQVIDNIEAQTSLSKKEIFYILRQVVINYTNKEGLVVITGENKPKLSLVS
jgi:hypothetical protein